MFSCMLIVLGLVTVNAQVDSVLICNIKSNNSKFINPHAENGWNIHRYQWTIEEDGSVLEERFSLNDEPRSIRPNFTFFKVRLEFGKDNMLDFIYHLDKNGNLINNNMKAAMDRIVYDNEGNFSRWMVFDKNKKPAEGNAPEFAIG